MMIRSTIEWCIAGTEAEFTKELGQARECFEQAWVVAQSAYDRCIAAHYQGRYATTPTARLAWHMQALEQARLCPQNQVTALLGSLYVNLGQSYEQLGATEQAQMWYDHAAKAGCEHQSSLAADPPTYKQG